MPTQLRDASRRPLRAVEIDRRALIPVLGAGAAFLMLAGRAQAQQVPIPTTAAEVPGPPPGTVVTTAYVQMVGRMAYIFGWPLVNMVNRGSTFAKLPEPGVLGGLPVGFGGPAMLTDYISPEQKSVTCPNQDVVYGTSFFALDKEPVVFQVPDFGERFWIYALYDARTDPYGASQKHDCTFDVRRNGFDQHRLVEAAGSRDLRRRFRQSPSAVRSGALSDSSASDRSFGPSPGSANDEVLE
jgi:hypothetical protein